MKKYFSILVLSFLIILTSSCGAGQKEDNTGAKDSAKTEQNDSLITEADSVQQPNSSDVVADKPQISIYYFHATHRCATCLAIEECITNVLNNHFSAEVKSGQIKRLDINADEEKNEALCEKYEAFGTSLFITQVFKGKENTTDLTSDAFKFARSKPEELESKMKSQIDTYLK